MAHQLFSINKLSLLLFSFLVIFFTDSANAQKKQEEVNTYEEYQNKQKKVTNTPMDKQKTKRNLKQARKVDSDIRLSEDARKNVSKDMKKFKPYSEQISTKQKKKNNKKQLGNPVLVEVDKNKGKKMNKTVAQHQGYVVVEKNKGKRISKEASNFKGGYVIVEKNKGRRVGKKAAQYRGYVVVDRSRNRRISRQAANFKPNYIKIKQQLTLTKMYYGKGHGKNSYKYVQKKRFAPHFKDIPQRTTKGKSNSMKEKPIKYTYSKDEAEIWN
ncbi:hypothetical protein [Flammeovirga sp. SJP92]|uniref:hypothetical protein n=1 Tax=Flammeovirga sp. SJP92 TaxID=1775430 RepID=UPI000788EBE2|nr:hypothetical protein [Flammeovirga sp. SJP92]KXX72672.1 hypothetical protein AVL50_06630 [Flammeovirga sp. SJP92]